jgi:hypothetical protein
MQRTFFSFVGNLWLNRMFRKNQVPNNAELCWIFQAGRIRSSDLDMLKQE